jgi:hypothetical protein
MLCGQDWGTVSLHGIVTPQGKISEGRNFKISEVSALTSSLKLDVFCN